MDVNSFKRSYYANALSIYAGVLAVLDLAWLLAFARTWDQLIPSALLLVTFAILAWRARRSGVVIQSGDKLVVRETNWTHTLPRNRVERFSVEAGRLTFRPLSGNFLVAELRDGRSRAFKDVNARPTDAGQRDLEAVAAALNHAWGLT